MEEIGEKIKRSIDENEFGIKSRMRTHLTIFDLTDTEYQRFIDFVNTKTPNRKGYEAIQILLNTYYKSVNEEGNKKEGVDKNGYKK